MNVKAFRPQYFAGMVLMGTLAIIGVVTDNLEFASFCAGSIPMLAKHISEKKE